MPKSIEVAPLRAKIEVKMASLIARSNRYAETTKYQDEAPALYAQAMLLRWVLDQLEMSVGICLKRQRS